MKERRWILRIHKSDDWRKQLSPLEFREQMKEDDIIKMQMLRRESGLRALWKEPCLAGPGTSGTLAEGPSEVGTQSSFF